jgi:hypothetical protein
VLPAVVHHFGHGHGRSPVVATFLSWLLSFGRAPRRSDPSTVTIPLQRTPLSPSTVSACCFAALDLSSPVSPPRPCVVTHLTCVCARFFFLWQRRKERSEMVGSSSARRRRRSSIQCPSSAPLKENLSACLICAAIS